MAVLQNWIYHSIAIGFGTSIVRTVARRGGRESGVEVVMRATWVARLAALVVIGGAAETVCLAEAVADGEFSKGGFAASG